MVRVTSTFAAGRSCRLSRTSVPRERGTGRCGTDRVRVESIQHGARGEDEGGDELGSGVARIDRSSCLSSWRPPGGLPARLRRPPELSHAATASRQRRPFAGSGGCAGRRVGDGLLRCFGQPQQLAVTRSSWRTAAQMNSRSHVPIVAGAAPRRIMRGVAPARSTSASSMQSPPARAVPITVSAFAPEFPAASPDRDVLVDQLADP